MRMSVFPKGGVLPFLILFPCSCRVGELQGKRIRKGKS
ncbi:Uncharacterized protein dnm_025540 [Desulfonema magnum]|uniref:Uncharacterized protein n=1 Tax=Desulfonema magnum TaxID=45655 RepID=A0A975BJX9_9BACT|nr:Uncharacterized protein dnm_025540 [Desulfonema magnum]